MKKLIAVLLTVFLCLGLMACGSKQSQSGEGTKEEGPSFIELISYAETALEGIIGSEVSVSTKKDDWDIAKTNLRYVLSSPVVEIAGNPKDLIIKIEFEDDTYSS